MPLRLRSVTRLSPPRSSCPWASCSSACGSRQRADDDWAAFAAEREHLPGSSRIWRRGRRADGRPDFRCSSAGRQGLWRSPRPGSGPRGAGRGRDPDHAHGLAPPAAAGGRRGRRARGAALDPGAPRRRRSRVGGPHLARRAGGRVLAGAPPAAGGAGAADPGGHRRASSPPWSSRRGCSPSPASTAAR